MSCVALGLRTARDASCGVMNEIMTGWEIKLLHSCLARGREAGPGGGISNEPAVSQTQLLPLRNDRGRGGVLLLTTSKVPLTGAGKECPPLTN